MGNTVRAPCVSNLLEEKIGHWVPKMFITMPGNCKYSNTFTPSLPHLFLLLYFPIMIIVTIIP